MEASSSSKSERFCCSSALRGLVGSLGLVFLGLGCAVWASEARSWGHGWTCMDKFCCWSQDSFFLRVSGLWWLPESISVAGTWQHLAKCTSTAIATGLFICLGQFSLPKANIYSCTFRLISDEKCGTSPALPCNAVPHYVSVCTLNWIPNLRIAQAREIGCLTTNPCKQLKWDLRDPGISCCLWNYPWFLSLQLCPDKVNCELWPAPFKVVGSTQDVCRSCLLGYSLVRSGVYIAICWKRAAVRISPLQSPLVVGFLVEHCNFFLPVAAASLLCLE